MNEGRKEELIETLASCIDIGDNSSEYFKKMREKGKNLDENKDLTDLEKFLKALANEERLKIVKILREQDRCVCELETILDKSQPTISHHLRILEEIGIIRGWKKGRFTHYDLIQDRFEGYLKLLKTTFIRSK